MIKRIGFTAIAAIALSVAAQAADMDSGTWVLNVAKSTQGPNSSRSNTHVISYDGGWRILRGTRINQGGSTENWANIGKPDGIARPSIGNGAGAVGMLMTSSKSDDFHLQIHRRKRAQPVG